MEVGAPQYRPYPIMHRAVGWARLSLMYFEMSPFVDLKCLRSLWTSVPFQCARSSTSSMPLQ